MNGSKEDIVRLWMKKAANDLKSAKKLASGSDKVLDTAIYHCQQAAEKAIKGYLVFVDIEVTKTHDLAFLVNKASSSDNSFVLLKDLAELLTPYATEYRYPDEELEPTQEEFEETYRSAKKFIEFIESKI